MLLSSTTKTRAYLVGALLVAGSGVSACFWNEKSTEPVLPIDSIQMIPAAATVRVGQTVNLTASARAANGDPIFGKTYVWTSGDTALLESRPGGVFFAKKVGSTTATATVEGFKGIAQVTIQP